MSSIRRLLVVSRSAWRWNRAATSEITIRKWGLSSASRYISSVSGKRSGAEKSVGKIKVESVKGKAAADAAGEVESVVKRTKQAGKGRAAQSVEALKEELEVAVAKPKKSTRKIALSSDEQVVKKVVRRVELKTPETEKTSAEPVLKKVVKRSRKTDGFPAEANAILARPAKEPVKRNKKIVAHTAQVLSQVSAEAKETKVVIEATATATVSPVPGSASEREASTGEAEIAKQKGVTEATLVGAELLEPQGDGRSSTSTDQAQTSEQGSVKLVEKSVEADLEEIDEELKEFLELRKVQQEPDNTEENEDEDDFDYEWDYRDLRQLPDSVKALEKRLKELLGTAPPDDRRTAVVKLKLALELCRSDGSPDKAVNLANEALKVLGVGSDDSIEQGVCLSVLGAGYRRLQQNERSLSFLKRAEKYFEEKEEKGQEVVREKQFVLNELGLTYLSLGRIKHGVEALVESLELQESVLSFDDPQLGNDFRKAAAHLCEAEEWEEAKKLCEKAIRVHSKSKGFDNEDVGQDRKIMAYVYRGLNQHELALEQFRIARQIFMKDEVNVYWANMGIADSQIALESYSEAIATLEATMDSVPLKPVTCKGSAYLKLAKAFYLKKNEGEARKRLMDALDFYKENLLAGSMEEIASQLHEAAALFDAMGDLKGSIRALKIAIAAYDCAGAETMVMSAKMDLGSHLITHGRAENALTCYKEALALSEKLNKVSTSVLTLTAIAEIELANHEAAVELLERAKASLVHLDEQNPSFQPGYARVSVYHNLVRCYRSLERFGEALQHQKLLVGELRILGKDAEDKMPDAMRVLEELEEHALFKCDS